MQTHGQAPKHGSGARHTRMNKWAQPCAKIACPCPGPFIHKNLAGCSCPCCVHVHARVQVRSEACPCRYGFGRLHAHPPVRAGKHSVDAVPGLGLLIRVLGAVALLFVPFESCPP